MVDWQQALAKKWPVLRFGDMQVETGGAQHMFEVQVYLNELDPNAVRVELFADGINGDGQVRQEDEARSPIARRIRRLSLQGGCVCGPSHSGHTARVTPLRRRCRSAGSRSDFVAALI
jgi:starch phosphorylase